ncbi:hypothetical protein CGCVW01_v001803 [Colletotrichum viniferum]|nr:hypothetical protein CGCVW01_v001803 [Colletotrichum viniferum]
MHAEAERLQQRPDLPDRGASDPVTPNPKYNSHIDRDLRKLIRKGPSTKSKERETGELYLLQVWSATADVELFKLGRTQADADTRRKQIKGGCKVKRIKENRRTASENVPFHGYAEKLAHTELVNFRYNWGCTCGTKHREYFDVSEDFAVEVFERWTDFCNQRPWTSDGKLLPAWEQRLNNKPLIRGGDRISDHRELAKHWGNYTSDSPTKMELVVSHAIRVWKDAFPERWQIVAIAELLTIICISPISFWVTMWAIVIGSLLLIDLVVTKNMHIFEWIEGHIIGGLQALKLRSNSEKAGRNDRNLSPSPEGHRMQTPTPSERLTPRGLDHLTFSAMQHGRYDKPSIMTDSSPGAYPNESPGATDCESDMEEVGCSSPCAERASRRRTPNIRVDLASANPENAVNGDSDMAVVN